MLQTVADLVAALTPSPARARSTRLCSSGDEARPRQPRSLLRPAEPDQCRCVRSASRRRGTRTSGDCCDHGERRGQRPASKLGDGLLVQPLVGGDRKRVEDSPKSVRPAPRPPFFSAVPLQLERLVLDRDVAELCGGQHLCHIAWRSIATSVHGCFGTDFSQQVAEPGPGRVVLPPPSIADHHPDTPRRTKDAPPLLKNRRRIFEVGKREVRNDEVERTIAERETVRVHDGDPSARRRPPGLSHHLITQIDTNNDTVITNATRCRRGHRAGPTAHVKNPGSLIDANQLDDP
jgi:hypothetical protein